MMAKIMGNWMDEQPDSPTEHDRAAGAKRRAIELIDDMYACAQSLTWDSMAGATENGRRYNAARKELLSLIKEERA
jgi:uncharacterized protein with FMN-binding domain